MFWRVSSKFILLNSSFRTNMHGSVCLFSRYLQHLFEGENLEELDISSSTSSDNIFKSSSSLSTGWTGTCPILKLYDGIQSDYTNEITSLNTVFSSNHQATMNSFQTTSNLIDNIFKIYTINSSRPSGSVGTLTPNFEAEFRDKTNSSLIGGEIYSNYINKLKPFMDEQNGNIQNQVNSLVNNNDFQSGIISAYSNYKKFDTAVATASNIMNENMLDLKDYFLTIQFWLMFFTWAYLLLFVLIIVLYIIYALKGYEPVYYILFILVNALFLMLLAEILMSSFFGQVRLICHEVPRAMNFIFTGAYMESGNSASYPAAFGRGDSNMTKMFTTCLNGDGNLDNLFIKSNNLTSLSSLQTSISSLHYRINQEIYASSSLLNDYNSISNNGILKGIHKLELMKNNLYTATDGFGNDEIYKILSTIRTNLDSVECGKTYEYYVIKQSDCPSGSIILNTIYETPGQYHCYIIQNLANGASASYINTGCDNTYINNAISFIKEINTLLDNRLIAVLQDMI